MTWEWAVVLVVFQACLAYVVVKVHDRERDHHDAQVESAAKASRDVAYAHGVDTARDEFRQTELRRSEWFAQAMARLDKVEREVAAAHTKAALR